MDTRVIYRALIVSLIVLSFAACSPPPPTSSGQGSAPDSAPPAKTAVFGIGDVETSMRLEARLEPASKGPGIRIEELVSMRKDLGKVDITVSPPAPEELWITVAVTKDGIRFHQIPVIVRGRIYIDEVEVKSFGYAFTNPPDNGTWLEKIDVLAGLDSIPKTMLVYADADLIMLDKGETIPDNLDEVETGPANTATIHSNPVRIDFRS